jgi:hypothetical protein
MNSFDNAAEYLVPDQFCFFVKTLSKMQLLPQTVVRAILHL